MELEVKKTPGIKKVVDVVVDTIKSVNVIDTKGDELSYNTLFDSIKNIGVLEAILIDTKGNLIAGNRRLEISKALGLKTIPAIIVDENLSEFEIANLRVDFLITSRNLSHIDICKIYSYQDSVFIKYNKSYADYMGDKMDCSKRAIQFKVKAGKMYSKLPTEVQSIFQKIDSTKKVPLKTLKVMSVLNETDLKNFNQNILDCEEIKHEDIVSITKEYDEMIHRKARKEKIDKEIQESQTSEEETPPTDEPLTEVDSESDSEVEDTPPSEENPQIDISEESGKSGEFSSPTTSQAIDDSHIIKDMKKVFQYEIKKSFDLEIEPTERKSVKEIQSKLHIDFKEEIELIKSLLGGDL